MHAMRGLKAVVLVSILVVLGAGAVSGQEPSPWSGQSFLSDYSNLKEIPSKVGKEFQYIAPGAMDKLTQYASVMVDQPEVSISPESPYKSAKPDDLKAIADLMRSAVAERIAARGFTVADKPGPGVLYLRLALTDLQLAKKKRGLLSYTPIGAVVHAGVKAAQNFLQKTDILEMSAQAELIDSQTSDILGAMVIERGASVNKAAGEKSKLIDFDEFRADLREYGDRLACRMANAKVVAEKRIDCTDPAARAALPGGVMKP